MSFDWKWYIQIAGELISHHGSSSVGEAYLRSAISRAYYGVFCIARNVLTTKGISIPLKNTHKFVSTQYQRSLLKREKQIGDGMRRLWRERKAADYEDGAIVDVNRANTAHQLAIRILNSLKTI